MLKKKVLFTVVVLICIIFWPHIFCKCPLSILKAFHMHIRFSYCASRENSFTQNVCRIAVTRAISWRSILFSVTLIKIWFTVFFIRVRRLILSSLLCATVTLPNFKVFFNVSPSLTHLRISFFFISFSVDLHSYRSTRSGRVARRKTCIWGLAFLGAIFLENRWHKRDTIKCAQLYRQPSKQLAQLCRRHSNIFNYNDGLALISVV